MSVASSLQIKTPEGVVFSLILAGPVSRFLAWTIDLACVAAISSILGKLIMLLMLISPDLGGAVRMVLYFAVSIGYGMVLEWKWRGQTVGKKLLRLRVMDEHGLKLRVSQIVVRNLLRGVDALPLLYGVGGVACLLSRRAQRLGDFAANTVVVRTPKIAEPDLDQILGTTFNSLAEHPHLAARLRQRVSPREATAALQALLRRDQLEATARLALFHELAAHFRAAVAFPEEATEGITDEQYVRNVLDILFRRMQTVIATRLPPEPA